MRREKTKKTRRSGKKRLEALAAQDPLAFEKDKVKGAVRTDFILSAEIVAITLGIVAQAPLLNQVLVLAGIALVVTIGVYGLVGIIVKLDDMGYWLAEKRSVLAQGVGKGLLIIAPWLMKALSIVGTLAMFLVGGGIVVHGIAPLHHAIEHFAQQQGDFHGAYDTRRAESGARLYYRRHCGGAGERCGENSWCFALIFCNELCKIAHPRLR